MMLQLDLILVVTMLPAWISCGVQASTTTTIHKGRLRGNPITHTRTTYEIDEINIEGISQESLLDSRTQHTSKKKRRHDKSLHSLPTGTLGREFNSSLYEDLHNAPFEIYESVFDTGGEEREDSFPVFIVPDWKKDATGVFSGFSRTATPLAFQNMKFLLSWNDIVEASTGAEEGLINFIYRNKFEASLFIGKTLGEQQNVPFLGLVVSYHQNSQKNIFVPFAKLENFFHDASEKYLLSESTADLEHDALHQMLDEARASYSSSTFFHPDIVADTNNNNKKEELEDIEALHFRRLFQLLIRRTFLFSFGYADCLKEEPHNLRDCLDDTFSLVIQMEASVREALDGQLMEELATVTKLTKASPLREACISVTPGTYGIDECSDSRRFRGLGGSAKFSTLATSTLR